MATYWENNCSFGLRYVSLYKYLSLVFSHLGFWRGNLFLIAPFPGLCLLVPSLTYPILSALFIFIHIIDCGYSLEPFNYAHELQLIKPLILGFLCQLSIGRNREWGGQFCSALVCV